MYEFAKYQLYRLEGISTGKRYRPQMRCEACKTRFPTPARQALAVGATSNTDAALRTSSRSALRRPPGFPRIHCHLSFRRHECRIVARMHFGRSSRGRVMFDASCKCCVGCAATGQEAKYAANFYDMRESYRQGYVLVCACMQISSSDQKGPKLNSRRQTVGR